jgi:hypothetical protein
MIYWTSVKERTCAILSGERSANIESCMEEKELNISVTEVFIIENFEFSVNHPDNKNKRVSYPSKSQHTCQQIHSETQLSMPTIPKSLTHVFYNYIKFIHTKLGPLETALHFCGQNENKSFKKIYVPGRWGEALGLGL